MNLFDGLQDTMFGTVTNTMGYDATWTPKAGGSAKTAKVLYNGPTEKEKLFATDFDPEKVTMEYKAGDLPGLFEATKPSEKPEVITITGIGDFHVRSIKKKWDGKTFEAQLKFKTA